MRNRAALFFLAASLMLLAVVLGGCSSQEDSAQFQPDLSVDIFVPYATATPEPEKEEEVVSNNSPFSINSEGDVTILDPNWVSSGFTSVDGENNESQYTQLKLGDSGQEVQNLQARLKELGYYQAEVSGVFDTQTESAVKLFELTYGNMQTGTATAKLQTLLFASNAPAYGSAEYEAARSQHYTTLQRGDVGSSVLLLQYRLMELGYPCTPTGTFDEQTAQAVGLFYVEYGVNAYEVASVQFQEELFSENAKVYSKADPGDITADVPTTEENEVTTLREGNIGTHVISLQTRLIELGYLQGEANGTFDEATAEAVRAFQRQLGMAETGEADLELQEKILSADAPVFGAEPTQKPEGYELLQIGSQGDGVSNLQARLIELGYAKGSPTGNYDDHTATAIRKFQELAGLEQTGVATADLQELLYSDQAPRNATQESTTSRYPSGLEMEELAQGSSGDPVKYLQTRLKALGYFEGEVDGEYGNRTEEAVKDLQQNIGVEEDGVADICFQQYIYSDAVPKSTVEFFTRTQEFRDLALGDSGEDVEQMQKQLNALGYLEADAVSDSVGTMNEATVEAVNAAQTAMHYLSTDSIASAEFQCFLFSRYAQLIQVE